MVRSRWTRFILSIEKEDYPGCLIDHQLGVSYSASSAGRVSDLGPNVHDPMGPMALCILANNETSCHYKEKKNMRAGRKSWISRKQETGVLDQHAQIMVFSASRRREGRA